MSNPQPAPASPARPPKAQRFKIGQLVSVLGRYRAVVATTAFKFYFYGDPNQDTSFAYAVTRQRRRSLYVKYDVVAAGNLRPTTPKEARHVA